MIVLSREIHNLGDFGFCHLECVNTTHTNTTLVDMKHDAACFFSMLIEKLFQDQNNKLHWRVVVIKQQDFVQIWLARFWTRFRNKIGFAALVLAAEIVVFVRRTQRQLPIFFRHRAHLFAFAAFYQNIIKFFIPGGFLQVAQPEQTTTFPAPSKDAGPAELNWVLWQSGERYD